MGCSYQTLVATTAHILILIGMSCRLETTRVCMPCAIVHTLLRMPQISWSDKYILTHKQTQFHTHNTHTLTHTHTQTRTQAHTHTHSHTHTHTCTHTNTHTTHNTHCRPCFCNSCVPSPTCKWRPLCQCTWISVLSSVIQYACAYMDELDGNSAVLHTQQIKACLSVGFYSFFLVASWFSVSNLCLVRLSGFSDEACLHFPSCPALQHSQGLSGVSCSCQQLLPKA